MCRDVAMALSHETSASKLRCHLRSRRVPWPAWPRLCCFRFLLAMRLNLHLITLVIVVVVCGALLDRGRPFSISRILLAFLLGGGELSLMPVLRFWRFCLPVSAVERPVKRREARRMDARTSHWRFFASHQSTPEATDLMLVHASSILYCETYWIQARLRPRPQ